jgi:hypothetical protein
MVSATQPAQKSVSKKGIKLAEKTKSVVEHKQTEIYIWAGPKQHNSYSDQHQA